MSARIRAVAVELPEPEREDENVRDPDLSTRAQQRCQPNAWSLSRGERAPTISSSTEARLKKFTMAMSKMLKKRVAPSVACTRRGTKIKSGMSSSKTIVGAAQTGPIVNRGGSVM